MIVTFVPLYVLSYSEFRVSLIIQEDCFTTDFPTPLFLQNGLCSGRQFMKKNGKLKHIPEARTDCKFEFFFF